MELVSVVIPTHFRPDRVTNAIESARKQSWTNLEIIVVSDGFDEQTQLEVEKLKKADDRISYISYSESHGGNFARNIGIRNSKGEYIAFLDDDDIWHREKIQMQMELLRKNHRVGLVGCGINVINVELGIQYKTLFKKRGDLSKDILFLNIIGSTSCVLVKREALDKCGYFDEILPSRQDHDLWIRICQEYEVDFVDSILLDYYVYKSNGKSQQTSKSIEKFIRAHEIMSEKYKEIYNHLTPEELLSLRATRVLAIAQRAVEVGDVRIAYKYAWDSWKIKKTKKALYYCLFSFIPYNFLIRLRALKKN